MILSDGHWRYELISDWAKIPPEVRVGDVAAVAVDRRDNVYLFTRGDHPVIVLDRDGNVLRTWGHDLFVHPHGLHIGADDAIYCTDDGDHSVRKCTLDREASAGDRRAGESRPIHERPPVPSLHAHGALPSGGYLCLRWLR